jgi:hypothetical protein
VPSSMPSQPGVLTEDDVDHIALLIRRMRATLDVLDTALVRGDHKDVVGQLGRIQRMSKDAEMVVTERLLLLTRANEVLD